MSTEGINADWEDAARVRALMDVASPGRDMQKALALAESTMEKDPCSRYLYALFLYTGTGVQCDRVTAAEQFGIAGASGCREASIVSAEIGENPEDAESVLIGLRFKAEQRDLSACEKLFPMYDTGKDADGKKCLAKKDHAEAVRLYMPCADAGNAEAQNTIGYMYLMGKGIEKNGDLALKLLKEAAEAGCAQAVHRIAYMYDTGQNFVEQDLDKAVPWYQKAADLGYADSEYALAGILFMRESKYFNAARASKYLMKAADAGHDEAAHQIGLMYAYGSNGFRRSPAKADMYLTQSCEAGNQQAMVDYANMCFEGQVLPKDLEKAAKWFTVAADNCSGIAQYALGCMYGNGMYYKQDDKKAYQFFQDAAEGGEPNSQYALACFYYEGRGVDKDEKEAAVWFQEAAEQGHPGAMSFLGMFKITGKAVDKDVEGGLKLLKDAAENDYYEAQFYLGKLYAEGEFVEKDIPYAKKMLSLAAKQGDPDAARMLDDIKHKRIS